MPFQDESFEFILSMAVLEHIQYHLLAMREAYRVLKSQGKFIGSVAFLEAHHGNSLYHHTHLGMINTLQYAGFRIERIAAIDGSAGLAHLAKGLFPKMPTMLSGFLALPLIILHKVWWETDSLVTYGSMNMKEGLRLKKLSSSFIFIAIKE